MDEGETKEAHVFQPVPYLSRRGNFCSETARTILERVVEAEAVARVLDRRGLVAFAWDDAESVLWSCRFQHQSLLIQAQQVLTIMWAYREVIGGVRGGGGL